MDEPQQQPTQIIDLMEALKASLAAKGLAPAAVAPAPSSEAKAPAEERKPAKRASRGEAAAKKASSKK